MSFLWCLSERALNGLSHPATRRASRGGAWDLVEMAAVLEGGRRWRLRQEGRNCLRWRFDWRRPAGRTWISRGRSFAWARAGAGCSRLRRRGLVPAETEKGLWEWLQTRRVQAARDCGVLRRAGDRMRLLQERPGSLALQLQRAEVQTWAQVARLGAQWTGLAMPWALWLAMEGRPEFHLEMPLLGTPGWRKRAVVRALHAALERARWRTSGSAETPGMLLKPAAAPVC